MFNSWSLSEGVGTVNLYVIDFMFKATEVLLGVEVVHVDDLPVQMRLGDRPF